MEFQIHPRGPGHFALRGELDETAARSWIRFCQELEPADQVRLDLSEVDLDSGPACALAVDAVRVLVARGIHPVLLAAPQALAHVLYRVGMLPSLTLIAPRQELPSSS